MLAETRQTIKTKDRDASSWSDTAGEEANKRVIWCTRIKAWMENDSSCKTLLWKYPGNQESHWHADDRFTPFNRKDEWTGTVTSPRSYDSDLYLDEPSCWHGPSDDSDLIEKFLPPMISLVRGEDSVKLAYGSGLGHDSVKLSCGHGPGYDSIPSFHSFCKSPGAMKPSYGDGTGQDSVRMTHSHRPGNESVKSCDDGQSYGGPISLCIACSSVMGRVLGSSTFEEDGSDASDEDTAIKAATAWLSASSDP